MLVLTRYRDEEVYITDQHTGERITICISEVRGEKVRLAFDAPDRFAIDRAEVHIDKCRNGGRQAGGLRPAVNPQTSSLKPTASRRGRQ